MSCTLVEPMPGLWRDLRVDGGAMSDGRVEKSRRAWWLRLGR
ncbi:hypothetical protein F383_35919 [Gossypium arboreum]|uniref:Uncharacterized protein n=1 Tax=Gossypium arboreum TaxID=29729 RepID=A0A0B0PW90_GOSAR|nr:hypothetical protein F383_35919 [Gossypium arboreum]